MGDQTEGLSIPNLIRNLAKRHQFRRAIPSAAMTGDDLTPEQLAWFKVIVGRDLRFYGRVRTRMERRRFRGDEPLYLAVCRAFDTDHGLSVNLHYLGCPPRTVGRRAKPESKEGETPERMPEE
jgi:phosphodiesterase/alkaline phosphatase D-like protein